MPQPPDAQALLVPYWAWRSTHRTHHKASASVERDENYVPLLEIARFATGLTTFCILNAHP